MIDKNLVKLEIYHMVGRVVSGTAVLAIGKYILQVWGG